MTSAVATITSAIPTENINITQSTVTWLTRLYESGALVFNMDGTAALNGEIRSLLSALHAVLSGGKVNVEVVQTGSSTYDALEESFEDAFCDANTSNKYRRINCASTMTP